MYGHASLPLIFPASLYCPASGYIKQYCALNRFHGRRMSNKDMSITGSFHVRILYQLCLHDMIYDIITGLFLFHFYPSFFI